MITSFKKSLGQNFLVDRIAALLITESADIKEDETVIEIGPGAGMVTQYLVQTNSNIYAVELDDRLIPILKNRFDDDAVNIIHRNVLDLDISNIVSNSQDYKVVGSLPYNISKKIIKKFLELENPPKLMVFLIQKEVAEDYTSKTPKSSFLSNYAQIYSNVEYIKTIRKEDFKPVPKVDGAIIKFNIKSDLLPVVEGRKFSKFLKNGFRNKRKKLVNNISSIYHIDKKDCFSIFKEIGIHENARASEITFLQWEKLFIRLKL